MLMCFGGRERTVDELAALAADCGLILRSSGSVAEGRTALESASRGPPGGRTRLTSNIADGATARRSAALAAERAAGGGRAVRLVDLRAVRVVLACLGLGLLALERLAEPCPYVVLLGLRAVLLEIGGLRRARHVGLRC